MGKIVVRIYYLVLFFPSFLILFKYKDYILKNQTDNELIFSSSSFETSLGISNHTSNNISPVSFPLTNPFVGILNIVPTSVPFLILNFILPSIVSICTLSLPNTRSLYVNFIVWWMSLPTLLNFSCGISTKLIIKSPTIPFLIALPIALTRNISPSIKPLGMSNSYSTSPNLTPLPPQLLQGLINISPEP